MEVAPGSSVETSGSNGSPVRADDSIRDSQQRPGSTTEICRPNRSGTRAKSMHVDVVLSADPLSRFKDSITDLLSSLEARRRKEIQTNRLRRWASLLFESTALQSLMSIIIVLHVCIAVHETNLRAEKSSAPDWMNLWEGIFLLAYILDLSMRFYVERTAFFLHAWNVFDVVIVSVDAFFYTKIVSYDGLSLLRCFRLFRVLRVFRILQKYSHFRELYLMIQGVSSGIRTILFAGLILFAIMTTWSIFAVEILNPLMGELAVKGVWEKCERCPRAFTSVMAANITFMKTILAGDAWGLIHVPLMENYSEAAVLITLVFLTIQYGVVFVITAVIVDRVQEARAHDDTLRKTMKEESLRKSYRHLWKVFRTMDLNGDGQISIQEMRTAYRENYDFRFLMNSMDFTSDNIDIFFDILDRDTDGEVTYQEFVEQLHMMREFDSHTMLVIIRHLMENLHKHIDFRFDNHVGQTQYNGLRSTWPGPTSCRESLGSVRNESSVESEGQSETLTSLASQIPLEPVVEDGPEQARFNTLINDTVDLCANPDKNLQNTFEDDTPSKPYTVYTNMLKHISTIESDIQQIGSKLRPLLHEEREHGHSIRGKSESDCASGASHELTSLHDFEDAKWMSNDQIFRGEKELRRIMSSVRTCLEELTSWGQTSGNDKTKDDTMPRDQFEVSGPPESCKTALHLMFARGNYGDDKYYHSGTTLPRTRCFRSGITGSPACDAKQEHPGILMQGVLKQNVRL